MTGVQTCALPIFVLGRIDQDDAILVEELGVSFDQNLKIALIGEVQPSAAIGQRIGPLADGGVEGRAHARSRFEIPFAARRLGIDAGLLPKLQFGLVRARIVAP